jgi:hypothetical protein
MTLIHGSQHTTAAEDIRLAALTNKFREFLGQQILHAMRTSKDGRLQMDMTAFNEFLKQAYYMGREDAGG